MAVISYHPNGSYKHIRDQYGNEFFYDENGNQHRDDGPAHITKSIQIYMKHGLYHRDDGPAILLSDGRKEYWLEGRLVGITSTSGNKTYYIDNKQSMLIDPPKSNWFTRLKDKIFGVEED